MNYLSPLAGQRLDSPGYVGRSSLHLPPGHPPPSPSSRLYLDPFLSDQLCRLTAETSELYWLCECGKLFISPNLNFCIYKWAMVL